jgi:hypothetical protein
MQSAISQPYENRRAEAEPAMTEFSHLYGSADQDKEKL